MQENGPASSDGSNVVWHATRVTPAARRQCAGQRGMTVWLTGLSGSGKSTIAMEVEVRLIARGHLAFVLDGDNLRHGLNAGVSFDAAGRAEAVRRAGEAALLMAQAGVVTLVSMISPYPADRDGVRARHVAAGVPFIEVHVDVPLAIAERRDPKGLYAKARQGQIKGFTGIDDPYIPPATPEVHLPTDQVDVEGAVERLLAAIARFSA